MRAGVIALARTAREVGAVQRRLVGTYVAVVGFMLLALGVPLAASFAMNDYHHLAIARLNDTARLAVQAAAVLRGEEPPDRLDRMIREYDSRTGTAVVVITRDAGPVLYSRPGPPIDDPQLRARVAAALAGGRSDGMDYGFNLSARPLFLAEPIESGTTVLGAVATITPTGRLRDTVLMRVVLLSLAGLVGVGAAAAVAVPVSRWILRPVWLLGDAAAAVAAGHYRVRGPQNTGPPEMRRLAHAMNAMADRLVSLLQAQRAFVADASHQLRNPLAALRLRVESLAPFVRDDGRSGLESALREVERLCRILDALLRLASAEAQQVTAQPVPARAVMRQRIEAWRPAAQQQGVRLAGAGPEAVAAGVPEVLDQVLDVLLDNAVGVAPPGSTVRVRTQVERQYVRVHVSDEGPGMTAEDKARAADRFWRGTGSGKREGSGLGLAIATTLLAATGGSLAFHDATPRGLHVVVTLPAWRAGSTAGEDDYQERPPAPTP
jgi:signal transduction histidine kinase